jgi:protein SCO1/2
MKAISQGSLHRVFHGPMSVTLAVLFAATLLSNAQTNSAPESRRPCCEQINSSNPLSDRSVYQLSSHWTTDARKTMRLGQLRGKPQVVVMFYSLCQYACPLLVHEVQQLAESLPANTRTNVGFLLVTFDSEHDTPDVLHAYRLTRKLPSDQWTLLHGRPEDVRELALVLGIKYRQEARGQFSHSNVITILNAEGEISFQQTGLANSPAELAKHLPR